MQDQEIQDNYMQHIKMQDKEIYYQGTQDMDIGTENKSSGEMNTGVENTRQRKTQNQDIQGKECNTMN